jgi:hypothetical protein
MSTARNSELCNEGSLPVRLIGRTRIVITTTTSRYHAHSRASPRLLATAGPPGGYRKIKRVHTYLQVTRDACAHLSSLIGLHIYVFEATI